MSKVQLKFSGDILTDSDIEINLIIIFSTIARRFFGETMTEVTEAAHEKRL